MWFLGSKYWSYLCLGSTDGGALWTCEGWSKFRIGIQLLADDLHSVPSLYVNQTVGPNSRSAHPPHVSWEQGDDATWCHGSAITRDRCSEWRFIDAQVMIPRRSLLVRESNQNPDVFIHLKKMSQIEGGKANYDQLLLTTVKAGSLARLKSLGNYLHIAAEAAESKMLLMDQRRISLLNQFESLVREDFYYRGIHLEPWPDLGKTRRPWKEIQTEKMLDFNF